MASSSPSPPPVGMGASEDEVYAFLQTTILRSLELAHEILVHPEFRLPGPTPPDANGEEPADIAPERTVALAARRQEVALRKRLHSVMASRLVDALHRFEDTDVQDAADAERLEEGRRVFVKQQQHPAQQQSTAPVVYRAKVVRVHRSEQFADTRDESQETRDAESAAVVAVDVCYDMDEEVETAVPLARIKTAQDPTDPTPLLSVIGEAISSLAKLTPRRAATIARELAEEFDLELIQQQVEAKVFTPEQLGIVCLSLRAHLAGLQSPAREAESAEAYDAIVGGISSAAHWNDALRMLPKFFELFNFSVEQTAVDTRNFMLQRLAPLVGPAYVRRLFEQRVPPQAAGLPLTDRWLRRVVDRVLTVASDTETESRAASATGSATGSAGVSASPPLPPVPPPSPPPSPTRASPTPPGEATPAEREPPLDLVREASIDVAGLRAGRPDEYRKLLALAVVELCAHSSVRLDTPHAQAYGVVPETLQLDAARLSGVRDTLDRCAIVASLVVLVIQTMAPLGQRMTVEQQCELRDRLDILLQHDDVSLDPIAEEVVRCAKGLAASAITPEAEKTLRESVAKTIAPNNAIISLFSSRVARTLLQGVLCEVGGKSSIDHTGKIELDKAMLARFSLSPFAKQLSEAAGTLHRVYSCSLAVHSARYDSILSSATASVAAPEPGVVGVN